MNLLNKSWLIHVMYTAVKKDCGSALNREETKMEVYVDTLCLLTQPKEGQQQFKNKNQSELTEN